MANYSFRVDGEVEAVDKIDAVDGDKTKVAECMDMAAHNAATFSPGDKLYFWSNDDSGDPVYRDTLRPPNSGDSDDDIEYIYDASCIGSGADLFSTWTNAGLGGDLADVWSCTASSTIYDLHYDGVQGDNKTGTSSLQSEGDWYRDSGANKLYLNSPSDPDTNYTSPGVEGTLRDEPIKADGDYITLTGNGAHMRHGRRTGIRAFKDSGGTNVTIEDFYVHDTWYAGDTNNFGIRTHNLDNVIIRRCDVSRSGWNGIATGSLYGTVMPLTNHVVEECSAHNNYHNGIDIHLSQGNASRVLTDVTIKHCQVYNNGMAGIYFQTNNSAGTISEIDIFGNVVYQQGRAGIALNPLVSGTYMDDSTIVNNTSCRNGFQDSADQTGESATWGYGIYLKGNNGVVKNNICFDNRYSEASTSQISVRSAANTVDVDYNLVFITGGDNDTYYYSDDGSYFKHGDYQEQTGQQLNGLAEDPMLVDSDNGNFSLRGGPPPAKDPDGVSNLFAWYDASQLAFGDGDAVTQWDDESGNGHHAVQATGANQPSYQTSEANGESVVRFDGSDWLDVTSFSEESQPNTLFIVAKDPSGSSLEYVIDGVSTDYRFVIDLHNERSPKEITAYASVAVNSTVGAQNAYHIWAITWNGASSIVRENGTQIGYGDAGPDGVTGFTIGSRYDNEAPFTGDIAEIVVYNDEVSPDDVRAIEYGLALKYDITTAGGSPCIGTADDSIGATYKDILSPVSYWPDGVTTVDQDDHGTGWDIGAYAYVSGDPDPVIIQATLGTLSVTGYDPAITLSPAAILIEPTPLGALTITGYNPVVTGNSPNPEDDGITSPRILTPLLLK